MSNMLTPELYLVKQAAHNGICDMWLSLRHFNNDTYEWIWISCKDQARVVSMKRSGIVLRAIGVDLSTIELVPFEVENREL